MDLFRWQLTGAPVRVGEEATFGKKPGKVTLIGMEMIFVDGTPVSPHLLGAEPIYPTNEGVTQGLPAPAPRGSMTITKTPITDELREWGSRGSPSMIVCPHCQTRGFVATQRKKVKRGISSGKAVAALFTAGLTAITPGIGLSWKELVTEATSGRYKSTWRF